MDSGKDFDQDLKELQSSIQVSEILAALNAPKTKSPTPANDPPPATAKASRRVPPKPTPEPVRKPPTRSPTREPRVFQNVTTKLTPETKELLRQAACLREADEHEPYTEYGIVNQAVEEWLKRHGYARRWKSEETATQEAEPSEVEAAEDR